MKTYSSMFSFYIAYIEAIAYWLIPISKCREEEHLWNKCKLFTTKAQKTVVHKVLPTTVS